MGAGHYFADADDAAVVRLIMKKLLLSILLMAGTVFAQNGTPHFITLTWTWTQGTGFAAAGFNIYRSLVSGGPYTKLASTNATTLTYNDTGGTGGQKYCYVITAFDASTPPNESAYGGEGCATFLGNPAAPGGVTAVPH